uniref:Uncharacterized protein n=1 Tax=Pithovirus LCPAC202 TaxID=2506592 RepID=A0A481Z6I7_9VIRU|nr:MAG: hypothetical protein LCPAC202_01290 [Pithovirus LCPAC202]
MVDVYLRETAYDQRSQSVMDKSNPIAVSWLEKRSSGRTSHMSFSPAASPHSSLERQTPNKFTLPISPKTQVSPKIHTTNVKPISGTGCMISVAPESGDVIETNNTYSALLNQPSN